MFGALLVLPFVGVAAAGGWTSLMSQLSAQDPNLLLPMGSYGLSLEGALSALSFLGVGLAFLGAPQLLTRFISARQPKEIVNGSVVAVICIIVFDCGAVFGGMAGRALFPGLADPETILPQMATELFPAVATGIFLVIVLAAIMSTVDSLLILASSAVVRDLLQKVFRPDLPDRRLSFYGKLVTVVIGAGGVFVALEEVRVVFWFVLFAWSGLASAFAPVVLCSLFWKGTTKAGAIAGMVAGFVTAVVWVLFFKEQFYDLYEMLPGFAAGFAVTILVSKWTTPPEGAAEELDSVWRTLQEMSTHD
jgi:Na+/proline symporter